MLGPLSSDVATRAFLACEVVDGVPQPDRPLVVVWIPDELAGGPRMAQLQRETALVTRLEHPNLARVYGLQSFEEGWARLVQYVDGESLRRVSDRRRELDEAIPPRVLGRIICDVCSAVHYAHQHGVAYAAGHPIVHGGLRPDTVLVSFSGSTLVTGYGASALAESEPPPAAGQLDRRHYHAPEQILGGTAAAGVVTDVYGIGTLIYELLSGQAPYRGSSDLEQAVLTGDLAVPMLSPAGDALMNVALRALSRRGSDRLPSVWALEQAVQDALQLEGVAGPGEVAEWVEKLFPAEETRSRKARQMLLDFASDPDAATALTVSRDLFAVPGPSTMPPFPSGSPEPGARAGSASGPDAASASGDAASAAEPGSEEAMSTGSGFADTFPSPSAYDGPRSAGPAPAGFPEDEDEGPLPVPSEVPETASGPPASPELAQRAEAEVGAGVSTPWTEHRGREPMPPRAAGPGLDGVSPPAASPPVDGAGGLADALSRPAGAHRARARQLVSEITHFDRRTGDGSRYALVAILIAAVGILAFIVAFPKEPPEGLAEPVGRTKLPPELVGAAMERAGRGDEEEAESTITEGATGAASIIAEPAVDVYQGSRRLGRTPATVVLPVGHHELRLTDAEHRINTYREIEILEGELTKLAVTFEKFDLVVRGPRGADVFLNAQRIDRLPVRPLRLFEGEYLLEVRYDGHRWTERIASAAGSRVEVAVERTDEGLVRRSPRATAR